MVTRLDHPLVEFFIHVDKNSDIKPFFDKFEGVPRVNFIKERHKIYWKGFSQIRGTMALMKASLVRGARFYILLSGSDYPVRTNDQILQFLEDKNTQYLHYFSLYDIPKWLTKIRRYCYWDSPLINPRQGFKPLAHRYRRFVHKKLFESLPERKFLPGLHPYGGANWWMLTHDCLNYCLEFLDSNKKFKRLYKFTDSPDEMVFQTIILNSHFAQSCNNFEQYKENREYVVSQILRKRLGSCKYNFRYVDWYSPERGFPSTLNEDNYDEMANSGALFARKMGLEVSGPLLDKIDKELLQWA